DSASRATAPGRNPNFRSTAASVRRAACGAESAVWTGNGSDTGSPTIDNVVDQTVNQVVDSVDGPGWLLPLLLFGGFRTLIDRLHAELAQEGHPDVRRAYGFAMQAIGPDGATATELGRRLGVSK